MNLSLCSIRKYMRTMSSDIIQHILSYTHQYQPPFLLSDIVNYHKTRREMTELYDVYWQTLLDINRLHAKLWMANDIICYICLKIPRCIQIMSRAYFHDVSGNRIKTYKDFNQFRRKLDKKSTDTIINVYWGILNPEERADIYCIMRNNINNLLRHN